MDSDSGEQSEGEPVTTAGTEGSRQPSGEGWDREKEKTGQEISTVSRSLGREGGRSPAARFVTGRDQRLLSAGSLLSGFLPLRTWARGEAQEVHLRVPLHAAWLLQQSRVARATWGWGRVLEI